MSSLNLEEVEGGEISSTSFSHTYYKIGIGREFKNKFRLSIAYEQSPLLYSEDSSDSELNLLYDGLSQYTFALDRNFLLGSKFSLTPFFSYSFIPNSSLGTYEINSGDNFLLGANLYYLKENFKLYTGTFYKQRRLNKEDTTDRDINIGFRFGVMFNY